MNWITYAAAVVLLGLPMALLLWAMLRVNTKPRQPDTPDDLRAFHNSAARWGHLPDRRRGGQLMRDDFEPIEPGDSLAGIFLLLATGMVVGFTLAILILPRSLFAAGVVL